MTKRGKAHGEGAGDVPTREQFDALAFTIRAAGDVARRALTAAATSGICEALRSSRLGPLVVEGGRAPLFTNHNQLPSLAPHQIKQLLVLWRAVDGILPLYARRRGRLPLDGEAAQDEQGEQEGGEQSRSVLHSAEVYAGASAPDKAAVMWWAFTLAEGLRECPVDVAGEAAARFLDLRETTTTLEGLREGDPLGELMVEVASAAARIQGAHAEAQRAADALLSVLAGDPEVVAHYHEQTRPTSTWGKP